MKYQRETTKKVIEIITQAGGVLKDLYYKSVTVAEKSPKDYVTNADIIIDNFLKDQLPGLLPNLGIYSEEQNFETIQDNQWIIDPIDGTANFMLGIPHFSISIAYAENSQVCAGFVYNPLTKELFWTDPWNKAMLNETEITVSARHSVNEMYGLFGFSANYPNISRYEAEWHELFHDSKKALGMLSPSLSICAVAKGKSDFFVDFGCSVEGKAAAAEILRKAGGKLCNYDKESYTLNSVGILATNGGNIF